MLRYKVADPNAERPVNTEGTYLLPGNQLWRQLGIRWGIQADGPVNRGDGWLKGHNEWMNRGRCTARWFVDWRHLGCLSRWGKVSSGSLDELSLEPRPFQRCRQEAQTRCDNKYSMTILQLKRYPSLNAHNNNCKKKRFWLIHHISCFETIPPNPFWDYILFFTMFLL